MEYFAVIDTETNWIDQVMSIGTIIACKDTLQVLDAKYHVITPEYLVGGMYEATLFADRRNPPVPCDRATALREIRQLFKDHAVTQLFAYNAGFDRNHLPELSDFCWYDIMRLAAYRQYNPGIPANADCYSTGRLKRGYGVEAILRLLSGRSSYCETHNALYDAVDELEIMKLLGHPLSAYPPLEKKI